MKETDVLLWHVHAPDGELLAATRYAIHAAGLALTQGTGAKVTHCGRVVLDVAAFLRSRSGKSEADWEAADMAARSMIDLAHGKLEGSMRQCHI